MLSQFPDKSEWIGKLKTNKKFLRDWDYVFFKFCFSTKDRFLWNHYQFLPGKRSQKSWTISPVWSRFCLSSQILWRELHLLTSSCCWILLHIVDLLPVWEFVQVKFTSGNVQDFEHLFWVEPLIDSESIASLVARIAVPERKLFKSFIACPGRIFPPGKKILEDMLLRIFSSFLNLFQTRNHECQSTGLSPWLSSETDSRGKWFRLSKPAGPDSLHQCRW